MFTVALAGVVMAVALPVMSDVSDSSKLSAAAREVEREFQSARLKAVSVNRVLRVRLNCPSTGHFRTVEYLNSSADTASNRCSQAAYPFPTDTDLMTRPNYDGPLRTLTLGATVGSVVLEFLPDGTAQQIDMANVRQAIVTPVTVTVTRKGKSKAMTINGAGKIQLQ